MRISDKIELLRKQRGISLTHLNNAIGAYRGKITDVRAGKTSFTNEEIEILAKKLNTSIDYLLGNTDDPAPAQSTEAALNPLTPQEERMLALFREMNEEGQEFVANFVDTMVKSGKYKKYDKFNVGSKEA